MNRNTAVGVMFVLALLAMLTGCGGGGGDTPVNKPPAGTGNPAASSHRDEMRFDQDRWG